jgi:uncharacterized protein (DUF58 family)
VPASDTAKGVYIAFDDLVRLQHRARGFSFRARQPAHSLLAGRRASRVRGRGLDLEEIRAYAVGDDVRAIDWRATARTGQPHTRVYGEERDRPALFVVDQRIGMFFGTRLNLKSVTAAEAAALGAWRVFLGGDRVGAVVFDDAEALAIRPHRSRAAVLRILEAIAARNRALRAETTAEPAPALLNQALAQALSLVGHDYLVVIASDFDGADAETRRLVVDLSEHNDVVALLVHDPSARELPAHGRIVMTGGELEVRMDVGTRSERQALLARASDRVKGILEWTRSLGVPVLPLSTAEDTASQMGRLLGTSVLPRRD